MATTYAAFYNLSTSRRQSSAATEASKSTTPKEGSSRRSSRIMSFLRPRTPVHEPLEPTAPQGIFTPIINQGRLFDSLHTADGKPETPVRFYDSVLRRPLFGRAKKGNEMTIAQQRQEKSDSSRTGSAVDRIFNEHLPGAN